MENGSYKKLHRSKTDKVFAGICGGLGKFFGVDPTVIRALWTVLVILTGIFPGVIAYLILILVIPLENNL